MLHAKKRIYYAHIHNMLHQMKLIYIYIYITHKGNSTYWILNINILHTDKDICYTQEIDIDILHTHTQFVTPKEIDIYIYYTQK